MASIGSVLGFKYKLLRVIGQGGMGAVYQAENVLTGRKVAVKTLHAPFAQQTDAVERFWQEARTASQIDHPNIVSVLDADIDSDPDEPFIVQELLIGVNLRDYLDARADQRLPVSEAVLLLLPIIDALVAAHAAGVVHRDLKPANIFLTRGVAGEVVPKLIDFGVSKLMTADLDASFRTATGMTVGTPAHMSPEQARGERDIDGRADVWSIGVLLYQLLTAKLPYDAPNHHVLVAKILNGTPRRIEKSAPELNLPGDLAELIHQAVEPERGLRIESMAAFRDALLGLESLQGVIPSGGVHHEVRLSGEVPHDAPEPSKRTREPHSPPAARTEAFHASPGVMKSATRRRESVVLLVCVAVAALVVFATVAVGARQRSALRASRTITDASVVIHRNHAIDAGVAGVATVDEDRPTPVPHVLRGHVRTRRRHSSHDLLAPDETLYRRQRPSRSDR